MLGGEGGRMKRKSEAKLRREMDLHLDHTETEAATPRTHFILAQPKDSKRKLNPVVFWYDINIFTVTGFYVHTKLEQ